MTDIHVLFRRRTLVFVAGSLVIFVFMLLALRYSYQKVRHNVEQAHGLKQQDLSARVAAHADAELRAMGRRAQQLAASTVQYCSGAGAAACDAFLARQHDLRQDDGVMDILALDTKGDTLSKSREKDFFDRSGIQGWPPEAARARQKALNSKQPGIFYSELFTYKNENNKWQPAILIAVKPGKPVSPPTPEEPMPPDITEDPAAPDAENPSPPGNPPGAPDANPPTPELEIGAIVIFTDLLSLSAKLQKWTPGKNGARLVMFGPDSLILSHPNPDFIGASAYEVLSLKTYPELNDIAMNMGAGRSSLEAYYYPMGGPDKPVAKWWMAYAPAAVPVGRWSVGITWPNRDTPMIGLFLWKYVSVGLSIFLLLVAANVMYLSEYSRRLGMRDELLKLHDISAINEILRNVNEELTEDKRILEAKTQEIQALHEQNLHLLEQVARSQLELFGTIRRPSREQRAIMRALKRDLETLQKKPEGRFWKKASED